MFQFLEATPDVYQGHFGEFQITQRDRLEVSIYRGALVIAALIFAVGTFAILVWGSQPLILQGITILAFVFCLAFGVSLFTIHIYMVSLHRTLQVLWAIGSGAVLWISMTNPEALALAVYHNPVNLMAVGWLFVALTGLFIKEAFCFDHWATKLLTALVPTLLLGHWLGLLSVTLEQGLLLSWAILFLIFAIGKVLQPIPPDIGDKSVFAYLKQSRQNISAS